LEFFQQPIKAINYVTKPVVQNDEWQASAELFQFLHCKRDKHEGKSQNCGDK